MSKRKFLSVRASPRWWPAVVLIAAVLLATNHHVLTGRAAPLWDAKTQFAPFYGLIADTARCGQLLIWNPFVNCGSPDFIESQFGALSPLTVGVGLLTGGSTAGYFAYWLILWLLGGLGVLVLGHSLGAPRWGAVAVAMGFMFCGIYTSQAQHLSHLCSISFLPWVLWRWDTALRERRRRPAIEAGLLWGLSALSGYPGLTVLSGGYLALWGVGRWLFPRSGGHSAAENGGRAPLATVAVGLLLIVVAGLFVLAPAYFGFFVEGAGYTERAGGLPKEVACYDNALHPLAIATLISPRLVTLNFDLRKVGKPSLFDYTRPTTSSVYAGAIVLVLSIYALAATPRDRWRWWLLAVGVLFLMTALGRALPLRSILYDVFPVSRFFRQTSMFRDYLVISMVVLALEGARELSLRLSQGAVPLRLVAISVALAGVAATALAAVVWPVRSVVEIWSAVLLLGVSFGALAVLTAIGARWPRLMVQALPVMLIVVAVGDAVLTQRISRRTRYDIDPQSVANRQRLDSDRRSEVDLGTQGLRRWDLYTPENIERNGDNLALKQPAYENALPLGNRLHITLGSDPALRRTALGADRVFFAAGAVETAPSMEALGGLMRATQRHGRPVLLVHQRGAMKALRRGPPGRIPPDLQAAIYRLPEMSPIAYRLLAYRPRELAIEIDAPGPGWLLVTDRWAGGWRATVNDDPTEVWGGNLVFRAVPVSGGPNVVRFSYRPPLLAPLLLLSWGSLLIGLSAAVVAAVRRTRAAPDPPL